MERSELIKRAIIGGVIGGILGGVMFVFLGNLLYIPLMVLICAIIVAFCTKASPLPTKGPTS
ncbi:MAG: hypothetical protein ACFFCO_04580 [Promethearchaeota archaeon]